MSRPKKDITKLSEQGIVTEEALVAYLNDKLTVDEKQELEKLLKDDPFARDALEGLQNSQNKSAVAGSLSSLNKKVRERSGLKEHKGSLEIHWANYAWAAVIVGLLIAIGFVMISYLGKTGGDNIAMNKKPAATEQTIIQAQQKPEELNPAVTKAVPDTITPVLKQQQTDLKNAGKPDAFSVTDKSKSEAQNADGKKATGVITLPTTSGTVINSKATTINSTVTAAANEAPTPMDKNARQDVLSKEKENWKGDPKFGYYGKAADSVSVSNGNALNRDVTNKKAEAKSEKKEAEKAVQLDDAMKSFNSADYKKSAEDFDKILSREPENTDALYFGGMSDYINGNLPKSEKNFDKLLKKGTKFVDGAKWYKANILVKKGSVDEGKKLLQELANSGGSYKERAVKKMAELGF